MNEVWATIIGVIVSGAISVIVCVLNNKNALQRISLENELKMEEYSKGTKDETNAIKLGLQALLRAEMMEMYQKWSALGYAPLSVRDNFENCWKNYHALGANGVMDNIHIKFLALPTIEPKKGKEDEDD